MSFYHQSDALTREIHALAREKGFWDSERNRGELFMLMISELGEALEAHRKSLHTDWAAFSLPESDDAAWKTTFERHIKDTFEDEIADTLIRILDYCGFAQLSLQQTEHIALPSQNIGEILLHITEQLLAAFRAPDDTTTAAHLSQAATLLLALSHANGFDLLAHIRLKLRYNATRARLHGKAY